MFAFEMKRNDRSVEITTSGLHVDDDRGDQQFAEHGQVVEGRVEAWTFHRNPAADVLERKHLPALQVRGAVWTKTVVVHPPLGHARDLDAFQLRRSSKRHGGRFEKKGRLNRWGPLFRGQLSVYPSIISIKN